MSLKDNNDSLKELKKKFKELIEIFDNANMEKSPFKIILLAGIGQVLVLKSQPQEKIIKGFKILLKRHKTAKLDYMPSTSNLERYGNLIYATEKHLAKETLDAA